MPARKFSTREEKLAWLRSNRHITNIVDIVNAMKDAGLYSKMTILTDTVCSVRTLLEIINDESRNTR